MTKLPLHVSSLQDQRFYIGSYLNQARHNAYIIIKNVAERMGQEDESLEESKLNQAEALKLLTKKNEPDTVARTLRMITNRLPFTRNYSKKNDNNEANPQEVAKKLRAAFTLLNQLRNQYTHFYHKPSNLTAFELEPIRLAAAEQVPKRFHTFIEAGHTGTFEGFTFYNIDDSFTLNGMAYFISLFLERKSAFQFLARLAPFKGISTVEDRATLECYTHFCCKLPKPKLESGSLELDMLSELGRCPNEIYRYLSDEEQAAFVTKLDEVAFNTEEEDVAVNDSVMRRYQDRFPYFALRYFDDMEVFPRLRFHIHIGKLRIKDTYSKKMFGVERERILLRDLRTFARHREINEEQLPKSWQKQFRGQWNLKENVEQFSPHYQITGNRIGLKFVNAYDHQGFPELNDYFKSGEKRKKQFQPDAIFSTYELRNLYFYQHLHQKGWIEKDAETLMEEFIMNFAQFCNDVKDKKIKPVAERNFAKKRLDDFDKKGKSQRSYYTETEKAELETRRAELTKILADYNLQVHYLPDGLREYLLGYQVETYKAKVVRKLNIKIEEELARERESKSKRCPRNGEMATYLATDLVFLKPLQKNNDGKPNNQQYKILQSSIAYFSINKEKIKNYLYETKILSKNKAEAHPFLNVKIINKSQGVLDFYRFYLADKIKALKTLRDKVNKLKDNKKIRTLVANYVNIDGQTTAVKNYFSMPLYLPRGLFNRPIAQALATNGFPINEQAALVHGLDLFFDNHKATFYDYDRWYENLSYGISGEDFLETLQIIGEEIEEEQEELAEINEIKKKDRDTERREESIKNHIEKLKWLSEQLVEHQSTFEKLPTALDRIFWIFEQQITYLRQRCQSDEATKLDKRYLKNLLNYRRYIIGNEQKIRHILSNDRVLWLMIKDLLTAKEGANLNLDLAHQSLEEIGFDLQNNLLDRPQELSVALHDKTIVDPNLSIKRYGEFRRFLKDRRLENLLKYYDEITIQRITLEEELDLYDRKRHNVFQKVLEFEEVFHQQFPEKFTELLGNNKIVKHTAQLQYIQGLLGENILPDATLNRLVEMRNKFSHNEIPYNEWLKNNLLKKHTSFSETLIEYAITEYDNLIYQMRKK